MPDTKDVKALLTDAIRKRDELNTFIKVLQEMGGVGVTAESTPSEAAADQQPTPGQEVAEPLTAVFPGMFFGKTQPQAAKLLLERVRRPVPTKMIIECFKKGGLTVGGKKPMVNLWSVLDRANETFILVPKAGWGLVEWYEPSVIAKYREKQPKDNGGAEEDKTKD